MVAIEHGPRKNTPTRDARAIRRDELARVNASQSVESSPPVRGRESVDHIIKECMRGPELAAQEAFRRQSAGMS
jgi:hypothetical protein